MPNAVNKSAARSKSKLRPPTPTDDVKPSKAEVAFTPINPAPKRVSSEAQVRTPRATRSASKTEAVPEPVVVDEKKPTSRKRKADVEDEASKSPKIKKFMLPFW